MSELENAINAIKTNDAILSINLQPVCLTDLYKEDNKVVLDAVINCEGVLFYFDKRNISLKKESLETFKDFLEEVLEKLKAFEKIIN